MVQNSKRRYLSMKPKRQSGIYVLNEEEKCVRQAKRIEKMTNIIRACPYVAGIDSIGMRSLKTYHAELTDKQIEKIDPLNANTGIVDYSFKVRKYKHGVRFEGEKEGGEISLFDEVAR